MTRTEHLFCILAEECAEIAQRASKVMRFGVSEIQPGQEKNNAQRLVAELADLLAVVEMLEDEGFIKLTKFYEAKEAKKVKIEKFLKYSEEQGTLTVSSNKCEGSCPYCYQHTSSPKKFKCSFCVNA